ncbi:MAG: hypothetical protein JO247_05085 [Chloroflexi bacterium]|nr:hypothetical protein [Chloroflexota bacterium]
MAAALAGADAAAGAELAGFAAALAATLTFTVVLPAVDGKLMTTDALALPEDTAALPSQPASANARLAPPSLLSRTYPTSATQNGWFRFVRPRSM